MKLPRDSLAANAISQRFSKLLACYPKKISQLATALGYTKPSTLYAIRDGKALPDIVRLKRLADQSFEGGKKPNISWLVSGEGDMLLDPTHKKQEDPLTAKLASALKGLPEEKKDALLTFLN